MLKLLRHRDLREIIAALLIMPLLIFSFFSAGTMPGSGSDGITIILCSGDGLHTSVDYNPEASGEDQSQAFCDWSQHHQNAWLPTTFLNPIPDGLPQDPDLRLDKQFWIEQEVSTTQKARAPPISSLI